MALHGDNGHQLHGGDALEQQGCEVVACSDFSPGGRARVAQRWPGCTLAEDLDQVLDAGAVDLVILCSSRRSEQAEQAIRCLEAGIHVYAEKPCALVEADLDRILAAAERGGVRFHEMAGTVCQQPYWAMRQQVAAGVVGEVLQVLVQKSYPFHQRRPLSEMIDGGLVAQVGVHALRFVEQVGGVPIASVDALDTPLGESRGESDLRMAASYMGRLANGGLFAGVANYANPAGFGSWGNEMVRVWGSAGMIEATDAGRRTRLVVGDEDRGAIDLSAPAPDFFGRVIAEIRDGAEPVFDLATELHPTRMVLRAAAAARAARPR